MDEVKRGLGQLVGQEVVTAHLDPIARELVKEAGVEIHRQNRARAPDPRQAVQQPEPSPLHIWRVLWKRAYPSRRPLPSRLRRQSSARIAQRSWSRHRPPIFR
jgi:hypothetical protein